MHQSTNNNLKLVSKLITGTQTNWLKESITNQERDIQVKDQFQRFRLHHISTFLIWIRCLHKVQELDLWCLAKLLLSIDKIAIWLKMVEMLADNFKAVHH